jgi:L-asparagine transporter-like permease
MKFPLLVSHSSGVYESFVSEKQMEQAPAQLRRELHAGQIAMVAVGGSIGTGLLLGSGAAVQVAGPGVIVSYIIGALISFAVTMALGEMSASTLPRVRSASTPINT